MKAMYLPSAQVEKAVHQLQDSEAICQMKSAAALVFLSVGGRWAAEEKCIILVTCGTQAACSKYFLSIYMCKLGFDGRGFATEVCTAERSDLQLR